MYLYFAFSGLFNALVSTFLGLLIFLKDKKNKINITFALFSFTVALWSYPYIFWPLAKTAAGTLLSFQLLHIGACYASVTYFHFVIAWLDIYQKKKKVLYLGYLLATIFAFSTFSPLFIKDMVPKFSMRFWAEPGILYHFYLLMFFSYFLYSSYLLFRDYRVTAGVKKYQTKYILIGIVLSFIGGSTNYLLWYNINFPPYGNIIASSFVIFTALAIIRYHLMDIKIFIRKSVFYLGLGVLLFGAYWLALWGMKYLGTAGLHWMPRLNIDWPKVRFWYFPISALINALSSIFLGVFLLIKDWRTRINRLFFYFCLSVAVWAGCYFVWQLSNSYDSALFWSRGLMFGAIWVPVFYLHLVFDYFFFDNKRICKILLLFFYGLASFWTILDFTPYFINSIGPKLFFVFWPAPGILFTFYLVSWFLQITVASFILFREFIISKGVKKRQSGLMLIGIGAGFLGGSTNYLLWYDIPVAPWGNILVVLMPLFIAYAILRYRFLDIHLFIRKWLFYLLLTLAVVGVYTLSAWVLKIFDVSSAVVQYGVAGLVAVLLSVFVFPRLERFLARNKLFFRDQYDHSDALRDLSQVVNSTLDFQHLAEKSLSIFQKIFSTEKAGFVLWEVPPAFNSGELNKEIHHKIIGFYAPGFVFDVREKVREYQERIFQFFSIHREVLLLQELPYKIIAQPVGGYEREQLIRVMEFLRGLNVEVALPIYYQDQLTAAVVFGAKAKKEIYSTQDIQLLETFGNQLALALANIKAYQKMKNYSEDLKKEVAAATAELQELNLKQSKFLADIAHELQSPVAILQGNLDLIQERGCLPALVENSSQSVGRLSRLIKDLLFLARADFGQLEIQKTEFDLNDLLREVYNTSQVFAEEKKINFQIKLPSKIKIFGDQEKLKSVFFNLLSNAFKHTPVGGEIIIATGKSSRKTKVSLYNSGLEIPVADLPHLFERFYHVDNGGRSSKEGVGLGLSIAKTIIEGHGGRIWAENVVDKGVKFWVEL